MTDLCGKCGKEPRAGKSRYGRTCLAENKRRQRETSGETSAREPGRETSTPLSRVLAENEALRLEVARLKRSLAEANGKLENTVTVAYTRDEVAFSHGGPRRKAGVLCRHGSPNCQTLACRAERAG